ncbi:MAG: hypothetical protein J6S63_05570 [Atopobiaceae bacterium]|nr:hypothetical protein [Atopobiaceae bacterium]
MDSVPWLARPTLADVETTLSEVNARLAAGGLSITSEDARMIAARRTEALAEVERFEFGVPAIVLLAEALATSPNLSQRDVAHDLAELQDAFYAIRDELPTDVPDYVIAEALRGCLDAWGDTAEVASMPPVEVMRFSDEYARMAETGVSSEYQIVDDEGRVYSFDPEKWDYDEHANGWDGERWDDDWGD